MFADVSVSWSWLRCALTTKPLSHLRLMNTQKSSAVVPQVRKLMYRDILFPKHLNPAGNVFGGVILAIVDKVAAMRTQQLGGCWVTRAVSSMEFSMPVHVGDTVAGYVVQETIGSTSLRLVIELDATSKQSQTPRKVVTAGVVMVHLNSVGEPMPHNIPTEATAND